MHFDIKQLYSQGNFKKDFFRKLVRVCLSASLVAAPMFANPTKACGYNPQTHRFITSQGILILKKDKGDVVDKLYEENGAQIIMDYSVKPDFDENDGGIGVLGGFRGHYYDPSTAKNFMGEKDNTANTRFCDHYNKAVSYYKNGDKEQAWQELGRALHYLQDLSSPHHAGNLPNLKGPKGNTLTHADYEAWVDRHNLKYTVESAPKETYDYVQKNTTWQIGHEMAVNAKANLYRVKSWYYELDDRNKRTATNNTLPKAQRASAGILYKFLKDVGQI